MIRESKVYQSYIACYHQLQTDQLAQEKIAVFRRSKEKFEQVEAYGKYAPDYKEKRRAVRQAKRCVDLDETVAQFRLKERELQDLLDHITYEIAQAVSTDIKVDAGNPFFEFGDKGCGGQCHVR